MNNMGKQSKRTKSTTGSSSGTGPERQRVELKIGYRVVLDGLKSTAYNDRRGTIHSLPRPGQTNGRYGILLDGSDKPVGIRREHIVLLSTNPKTTEEKRRERERTSVDPQYQNVDFEQLQNVAALLSAFESMQRPSIRRSPAQLPDLYQELLSGGGIPLGIRKEWAKKYLFSIRNQSIGFPQSAEMELKSGNFEPSTRDVYQRINSNHPKKVRWYCDRISNFSKPGAVFPMDTIADDERTVYGSLVRQSFSNSIYLKEALYKGTTHVAVGFVDLGILLAASLEEAPDGQSGPLRFLGVEMCSYSVAKTYVIWEMLKQTPVSAQDRKGHMRSIAQVWFSTTWDEGTAGAVKSALTSLCANSKQMEYHPEVKKLLEHWFNAPLISLKEARKQHRLTSNDDYTAIPYLMRKNDRVAQARYELTGDFALGGQPRYGNTIRFDCPDGTAPPDLNETVFSVLSFEDIAEALSPSVTVVDAAEKLILANIAKLSNWVVAGDLTVELICAKIQDVLEDVVDARPWTMSWSNVLDYMKHRDFHQMARACSVNETVHFAYSMNWTNSVFGTYIIDYFDPEQRSRFIDIANDTMRNIYKSYGWSDYLRLPRPSHPVNTTCQYALEVFHHPAWLKYFFAIARKGGPCKVGNFEHGFGSPLSHTGATQAVAFTWTYDPENWFIPRKLSMEI